MSEQVERLMRDGSAPDGGYCGDDEAEAWDAFMEQSEAILGRPLSLLEIPDELPSFEEMYGYTPGDQ